jgi:hypothetical protein
VRAQNDARMAGEPPEFHQNAIETPPSGESA